MAKESSQTITKEQIRRQRDGEPRVWYFSIVDVLEVATDTSDARNYWKVLKNRLKKSDSKLVTKCNQLKMKANDGKLYLTDTADSQTILELIDLVAPESVEDFKVWFYDLESQSGSRSISGTELSSKISLDIGKYSNSEDNSYPQAEGELQVDVYRKNNFFIITAFVAGTTIDNILISVNTTTITIKGKREQQKNITDENYFDQELYWGAFSRTISLPSDVEASTAEATENQGLLTIKVFIIDKEKNKILKIKSL